MPCSPGSPQAPPHRTTSPLEGGINAHIKNLLRAHRGMSPQHARTAIDWYLNSRTEHPYTPWEIVQAQPEPTTPPTPTEQIGPQKWGTATTAEEGLWPRTGWAGH